MRLLVTDKQRSLSNQVIMMKILLVEDSKRLQVAIGSGLRKSGFVVDISDNGNEGLNLALTNEYDVMILDLMLPELDGLTVLKRLRKKEISTPILILSARYTVEQRVEGLRMGADDYLIKPFAFDELLARIQVLVRRKYKTASPLLRAANLEVDTVAMTAVSNGKKIPLARREYRLLEYLLIRQGQLVTRKDLEEHMYVDECDLKSNTLDASICLLRKSLRKSNCHGNLIQTKRGLGYILAVQ